MRRASLLCVLVAALAVAAHGRDLQSARELQQFSELAKVDLSKLPALPALGLLPSGVQLPPLKDFLPPLESLNLPPLNDFLKSVGLPSWEEMNLPPISEFMKPVFDPEAVKLPNLNDVLQQANATFVATVKDIVGGIPLPPGVKLPELKLPPLNVDLSKVDLSNLQIPNIDTSKIRLPSLEQVIKVVNTLQSGQLPPMPNLDKLIPADLAKSLPPASEIVKALQPLLEMATKMPTDLSKLDLNALLKASQSVNLPAVAKALQSLPKIEGLDKLPPFEDMVKGLLKVASTLSANAAPAAGTAAARATPGRALLQTPAQTPWEELMQLQGVAY